MNLNHSKKRRWICLLLSACLFVESGYAATGLNQDMIDTAKTFFNKTEMGKVQTVGEWYNKVKANIPAEYLKQLEPWAKENKNKTLPPFTVQIKNTTQIGKYIVVSFTLDGKKSEWTIKQDAKGISLSNGKAVAHQNELEKMNLSQDRQPFTMSFKEFKERSLKNPEWGKNYINNLRQFYADMEKYQPLFLKKKSKKTSFHFQKQDLFIEKAYAQQEDGQTVNDKEINSGYNTPSKSCVVAGWAGVYVDSNGFCTKYPQNLRNTDQDSKDAIDRVATVSPLYNKCPTGQIDCNPYVYGYTKNATSENPERHCVDLKPKEGVSVSCDDKAGPIKSAQDLKDMLSRADKIVGTKDGDMLKNLRENIKTFRAWCLTKSEQDDDSTFPFQGRDNQNYTEQDFTQKFSADEYKGNEAGLKGTGANDSNYHSRMACATMFNRLKFLDASENGNGGNGGKNGDDPCKDKHKGGASTGGAGGTDSTGGTGGNGGKNLETNEKCPIPAPGLGDKFVNKNKEDSPSRRFCRSGTHPSESDHISTGCAFGAGVVVGAAGTLLACFLAGCFKKKKTKTKVITNTNTVVKEVPGATITKEVIKEVPVPGPTIIKEVPGPTKEVIKYVPIPTPPPPPSPPPNEGSEDVNPSGPNRPGPDGN